MNALLQSPEVRKRGPVLRLGQVTGQWKEGILVLTRSGFVHWCHEQEVSGHSHNLSLMTTLLVTTSSLPDKKARLSYIGYPSSKNAQYVCESTVV
jgi:hypothetical protein